MTTPAERVVARLDSYSQAEHLRRINEARERLAARRAARRERARAAAENLKEGARVMTEAEVIEQLDRITDGDPEGAHGEADDLLLKAVSPEVAAAYERARDRVGFWYA